jgi:hypothetical protein
VAEHAADPVRRVPELRVRDHAQPRLMGASALDPSEPLFVGERLRSTV